jgi:hypothetical protein
MPLFEEFEQVVPNIVGRTRSEQAFVKSSVLNFVLPFLTVNQVFKAARVKE